TLLLRWASLSRRRSQARISIEPFNIRARSSLLPSSVYGPQGEFRLKKWKSQDAAGRRAYPVMCRANCYSVSCCFHPILKASPRVARPFRESTLVRLVGRRFLANTRTFRLPLLSSTRIERRKKATLLEQFDNDFRTPLKFPPRSAMACWRLSFVCLAYEEGKPVQMKTCQAELG